MEESHLSSGGDGLKQVEAVGVAQVGHGDGHGVLKECASVDQITVCLLLLNAQTVHVLLIDSVLLSEALVFGLQDLHVLSLSLAELLGGFPVSEDLVHAVVLGSCGLSC
jgi:hypothetical protein